MLKENFYPAKAFEQADASMAPIPSAISSLTGFLLELDAVAASLVHRLERVLAPTNKCDEVGTEPSYSVPLVEDLHGCEMRVRSVIRALRDADERLAL